MNINYISKSDKIIFSFFFSFNFRKIDKEGIEFKIFDGIWMSINIFMKNRKRGLNEFVNKEKDIEKVLFIQCYFY